MSEAPDEKPVILIVDDDPTTLHMLEMMIMSSLGHSNLVPLNVRTAAGGDECIPMLRTGAVKPILIIMDALMPGMNGFELTTFLQRNRIYEGPIIMLTAMQASDARTQAIAAGCAHYITKPVNPGKLIEDICTFVPELRKPAA